MGANRRKQGPDSALLRAAAVAVAAGGAVAVAAARRFASAVRLHRAAGAAAARPPENSASEDAAPGWRGALPRRVQVLTVESGEAEGASRPRRTWVVENGPEWDGSDDELIRLRFLHGSGPAGPEV